MKFLLLYFDLIFGFTGLSGDSTGFWQYGFLPSNRHETSDYCSTHLDM